jgi:DNA-binding SARP family transcriptional activator
MGTTIRLLGKPSIEVDGLPGLHPRGRKSWAVLAFLALSERPPSRQRLASLLFADADDPLGALRWTLAELRRVLGGREAIVGDPLSLSLRADTVLDVVALCGAQKRPAIVAEACGELLEGMVFAGCDAFESWLLVERRHHAAVIQAVLRETALACLGAGQPREAARLATRLVEWDHLDEGHHVLLVRSLARCGERRAALDAVSACQEIFRRELSVEPSPAVLAAADATQGSPTARALGGVAAARAQLEAGSAAISAGAVDAGLDCLRRAVEEARLAKDDSLLVRALAELGGALVHSVRGRDDEGALVLHEAVERALTIESRASAGVYRELGFVDVQAGRGERAGRWLDHARQCARQLGDDAQLSAIDGVEGMNLSDQAHYDQALDLLTDSVERGLHSGSRRQAAWSASLIGRLHLLRGDVEQADEALRQSLEMVRSERWVSFLPWPETLVAEVDMCNGRHAIAEDRLANAFALACQLGDPCWEGVAARGLGVLQARHDPVGAMVTLSDARSRCIRWPDAYQWIHGYVLDATCVVATSTEALKPSCPADDLLELAASTGMRELATRAQVHRDRLGIPGALLAAQIAGAGIVNPSLQQILEGPSV